MSDEDNYVYDSIAAQAALNNDPNPVEPRLSQIDDVSAEIIKRLLYKYEVKHNPTTGDMVKVPVNCNYPDIENALGYALSHLNLVINVTWEESRSLLLDWWGTQYRPLKDQHRRDKAARQLLTTINNVFVRNILASAGGSHQNFIVKQMGGSREVNIRRDK